MKSSLPFLLFLAISGIAFGQTPVVAIRATDPSAIEKSTATTASDPATVVVSRSGNTTGALTVNLTATGNAVLTTDFTVTPAGATTSVTIPDGKASVTVVVTPVDNTTQQNERLLTLTLAASANYTISAEAPAATVRIADMDKAASSTFNGNADLLYNFKTYSGTYSGSPATIAIPTYRGVEVPVVRVAAQGVSSAWQARWAYENGVAFYSVDNWQNTLAFLPTLATASGHPEVANAMYIGIGVSSGATAACQVADREPDRSVFAFGITNASSRYAPSITTYAEFDDAYKFYHGTGGGGSFGAIHIGEDRVRHTYSYELGEQKLFFYDKFVKLRADYQPGVAGRDPVLGEMVAQPIDYSHGYVGESRFDTEFFNYATWEAHTIPVKDYNKPYDAKYMGNSWLPDAATAAAWRAFVNRGENHCSWEFPQLGYKDDMTRNNTMVHMVNTAQSQPCTVDTGLFADADVCEFYDNEVLVAKSTVTRTDAGGYRVFDHTYTWDDSRLGVRLLHAVLENTTTGKRVQVSPPRVVYAVTHKNDHNTAPTISPISGMSVNAPTSTTTIDIPFTIGDAESSTDSLQVKFGTPDEAMMFYNSTKFTSTITGTGANRTLSITLDPANINSGGVIGGVLMVSDGELCSNAYVAIKIRIPDSAPFFRSPQTIGTMTFLGNDVGYDDEAPSGDGMNMCVVVNGWSKEWSLTVRDWDNDPRDLTLTAVSNTPATLPTENIIIGGYGPYRTIQVRPIAYGTQNTSLTLYLSDGTHQVTRTYKFLIIEDQLTNNQNDDYKNTPPHIGCIPDQTVFSGEQSKRVYFQVADYHTASEDLGVAGYERLKVVAFSDNESVVPNSSLFVGDPGQKRWLTIKPAAGVTGTATITVVVTDEAGLNSSSQFKVTVTKVAPQLEADEAGNFVVVDGSSKTFRVTAYGGGLSYQWYRGPSGDISTPISGATTATLDTGALAQSGQYWCRVSNSLGYTDSATQTVSVVASAPVLTVQPQNVTASAGDSVRFSVTATGEELSYQWYAGASGNTSSPISGATDSALTVPAVAGASYWCRVSNLKGSADSSAATVSTVGWFAYHDLYTTAQISDSNHANVSEGSVSTTPYTLKNFATGNAMSGVTITFTDSGSRTAQTTGANPSSGTDAYALFNGKLGVGAKSDTMTSSSTVTFAGLTPGRKYSVAFYTCRNNYTNQSQFTIQGASGYTAASSAGVTLGGTNGNTTAVVEVGSTADTDGRVVRWDNITANNGTSFSILVNKSPLGGASANFVLPQATMLREYAASTPVIVSVTPTLTIAPNGQATISVETVGNGLTYQWYQGTSGDTSTPIAWDATSGTYTTGALAAGASYWVRVTGGGVSVDSATMTVAVSSALLAPTLTSQPSSQTCEESESATFAISATSATGYQWRKNGTPIDGATASSLTLASTTLASAGNYDCLVGNAHGTTASSVAKLTVNPGRAPTILVQPNAWHYRDVDEDEEILEPFYAYNYMMCYAAGSGNLSFQWRRNGVPISDKQEVRLYDRDTFVSKVWHATDSGVYDCVVSNAFGSVVSDSVVAVVNYNVSLHTGVAVAYLTSFSPDSGSNKWVDVVEGGSVTLNAVLRGGSGTLHFGEKPDSYTHPGDVITPLAEVTTATDPNKFYLFSYTVNDVGSPTGTYTNGYVEDSLIEKSYEFYNSVEPKNYSTSTLSFKTATAPNSIVSTLYNSPGVPSTYMYLYQSKTIAIGQAVYALAVTAYGTAPFTYQWYKDGVELTGETKAALIINNAQLTDTGAYHVVITNSVGSYTAPAITWTVSPDIIYISTQPQTQTKTMGESVTFSISTTGATPGAYQWYKDGVAIAGATSTSYSIASVSPAHEGRYTCKATREWQEWDGEEWMDYSDSKTSNAAELIVVTPPVVTEHPQSQVVAGGQTFSLRVSAAGSIDFTQPYMGFGIEDLDFTYQWRKGGVNIGGATANTLTISNATSTDDGSYDCVITSMVGAGSVISNSATISVLPPPPDVTSQSSGATVNQGEGTTITVAATGDSLIYQWYRGTYGDMSAPLAGGTGPSLSTGPLSETSLYWVHVSNSGGMVSSMPITVGVIPPTPPTITAQPQSAVISVGGSTSLSVSAAGTSPFSYQWKKGGANIGGATSATFVLGNATLDDTGIYTCAVTNLFGTATSLPATVVVSGAPIITSHPQDASIAQSQTATLSVAATGFGLSYQWYEGTSGITTSPVAGAASASFTTPALVATTSYWCRVSNANGAADSNTATVRLPNWEAYHDTVELVDNGGTYATQNTVVLTSSPTTTVPVVNTLKNFVTGADMTGIQLTQSRTGAAPAVASTNSSSIAPAVGTDAHKLFGGKIVVGQKIYQIANGSTYTFAFAGLNPAKRYAVAFFASRDDSRYTVKTKLTLLGASGWTNASSNGTIAISGTNDATIEVDVCAGSAAAGRVIRWNDISVSGSTFSVKAEMGSNGTSFVVPQCVALIEYDVPAQVAAPEITTQPVGANISSGGNHTLTVAATGTGLAYQWFAGFSGDTSAPVAGATGATFTTPALTSTSSYWVRVSNSAGAVSSHTATALIDAPPQTPLESWASSHGLAGANASPMAAPHGDNVPNLVKFALGLPGNAPAAPSALPSGNVQGTNLSFEFHRATDKVRYVIESSSTLAPDSWTTELTIEKNSDPASVGADIAIDIPIGTASKKFVRLRVAE